jgi:hypothetical protein
MRCATLALALALALPGAARADSFGDTLQRCLAGAARRNNLPPELLVILYENEGGTLGRVSQNTNGTVDIGPFQINKIWLPILAAHWGLPQRVTYDLLLGQFCANAEAAAWILRTNLDAAQGDLWEAVGRYHSANPTRKSGYLKQIYAHIIALMEEKPDG